MSNDNRYSSGSHTRTHTHTQNNCHEIKGGNIYDYFSYSYLVYNFPTDTTSVLSFPLNFFFELK